MNTTKAKHTKLYVTATTAAALALGFLSQANPVSASTVKVHKGDTLWGYAEKYDTTVDKIAKENGINLDAYMMWPGDSINIPDGKKNTGKFTNHFVVPAKKKVTIASATKAVTTASATTSDKKVATTSSASSPSSASSSTSSTSSSVASSSTPSTSTGSTGSTGATYRMKVSFYDPAVLGASTMPGGMYSGVAANLNQFPKGTRLRITLPGNVTIIRTVNDTGAFVSNGSGRGLDIAMKNSQIPSYGVGMATVTVLK